MYVHSAKANEYRGVGFQFSGVTELLSFDKEWPAIVYASQREGIE
jgi:hypothetical protein